MVKVSVLGSDRGRSVREGVPCKGQRVTIIVVVVKTLKFSGGIERVGRKRGRYPGRN